jgi:hypothetical protein
MTPLEGWRKTPAGERAHFLMGCMVGFGVGLILANIALSACT